MQGRGAESLKAPHKLSEHGAYVDSTLYGSALLRLIALYGDAVVERNVTAWN
jgi:hypothetical protein